MLFEDRCTLTLSTDYILTEAKCSVGEMSTAKSLSAKCLSAKFPSALYIYKYISENITKVFITHTLKDIQIYAYSRSYLGKPLGKSFFYVALL